MKLLLTAGGTREPVDAVRYLGNRSSGRMGAAIAAAALEAGHEVTAVCGSMTVAMPDGVDAVFVETTRHMHDAVLGRLPASDALVMAAAVADFRPKCVSDAKLRRSDGLVLELEPTEDILAAAGRARRGDQFVVGFSLDEDTADARERAKRKLVDKGCDLLIFNPIATLDSDRVRAVVFDRDGGETSFDEGDKPAFARRLVGLLSRAPGA